MRTTGIIRETDKLGRIVLPIELRKSLGINEGDKIEVLTEGNSIILRKQNQTCTFCGSSINIKPKDGVSYDSSYVLNISKIVTADGTERESEKISFKTFILKVQKERVKK